MSRARSLPEEGVQWLERPWSVFVYRLSWPAAESAPTARPVALWDRRLLGKVTCLFSM